MAKEEEQEAAVAPEVASVQSCLSLVSSSKPGDRYEVFPATPPRYTTAPDSPLYLGPYAPLPPTSPPPAMPAPSLSTRDPQYPLSPSAAAPHDKPRGRPRPQLRDAPRKPLVFQSPRLQYTDEQLFPTAKALSSPQERWEYMRSLAGPHQQDGKTLRLSMPMTPRALPLGMPQYAASRVKELHLPPRTGRHRLPQWMDAVQTTFRRLQHLYMHPAADESDYSKRLRRLYVLYRLPGLQSIDGQDVTETERRLARPLTPNGQKVSRQDWMEQRLAEEDRQQQAALLLAAAALQKETRSSSSGQEEAAPVKKEKVDRQAWLAEVLDEEKEPETPQSANVEVDLAGRLTAVALSPPDLMKSEFILETTSSVATADCAWAASCGHFFRPDSMRRQWNKSRLGVRFSSRRTETKLSHEDLPDGYSDDTNSRTSSTCSSSQRQPVIQTENEYVTVLETEATSPIMSKTVRYPKDSPQRLVLDADKSSPDQRPSLVIKTPLAPTMPLSTNGRNSPSRSLSSPFPIQFRARTIPQARATSPVKGSLPQQPSLSTVPSNRSADTPRRIQPSLENSDPRYRASPRAPSSMPRKRGESLSITGISKLSDPVPMQRTKSTPNRKGKRDLPPPCPGGGRRLLKSLTPRISKWKKQTARSTSIIDDEEESEDDDGQEESMLVVVGTA